MNVTHCADVWNGIQVVYHTQRHYISHIFVKYCSALLNSIATPYPIVSDHFLFGDLCAHVHSFMHQPSIIIIVYFLSEKIAVCESWYWWIGSATEQCHYSSCETERNHLRFPLWLCERLQWCYPIHACYPSNTDRSQTLGSPFFGQSMHILSCIFVRIHIELMIHFQAPFPHHPSTRSVPVCPQVSSPDSGKAWYWHISQGWRTAGHVWGIETPYHK